MIVLNPPLLPFPRPANLSFGIHIKLDADIVAFFKRQGAGYHRAVQRSQLSPGCNSFQDPDAEGVVDDSVGRKSLNLCEATESIGGRLEVAGAVSRAARRNP